MKPWQIHMTVDGRRVDPRVAPHQTLLEVLREEIGSTDVKYGCGEGVCGTCTVLLEGETVSSCTILAVQVDGSTVTTVRGLSRSGTGGLHPLQRAFLEHGASQCGFCTPGMLLAAHELVSNNPRPTRDEIRRALAGNVCRCTGYTKILDAVQAYARDSAAAEKNGVD